MKTLEKTYEVAVEKVGVGKAVVEKVEVGKTVVEMEAVEQVQGCL